MPCCHMEVMGFLYFDASEVGELMVEFIQWKNI